MKKHLLVTATALALAFPVLSSAAFAEPDRHHEMSTEDHAAFIDAKVAALKAGLKLTPAQEKNWPAVETALRDIGKARQARFAEAKEKFKDMQEHRSVIDGLRFRSKALAARSAEAEKLADAAKPLYDSLDDGQKRRFGLLLRTIAHGHMHHWGHHDHDQREDAESR
ncbi:Spy/CpxP family protein refolding chaperone [Methylosinus sp. Sm6]|uniref:Spy/CpxP family protein refolding chaperone n=1 Tax=Methylosinus sp. Sm6 TaxID=2866948 RepID=UPI001C99C201|nr:Spy/CpxP family protein refolding chaperone [Methylosinus sp. Sm6]MBY6242182.1 Spy/CpxP family protein refolding chaperone [Methylosinus sp. Sm6]